MQWVQQYSFTDLNPGFATDSFGPESGLRITRFEWLDDHTILLAGSKNLRAINKQPTNTAVVFISKNKGADFQEIMLPGEKVTWVAVSPRQLLIMTNAYGLSEQGMDRIFLMDKEGLQFKKVAEYASDSDIMYDQFNGEYVLVTDTDRFILFNPCKGTEINLPRFIGKYSYNLEADNTILYLTGNRIRRFDPFTGSDKQVKKLQQKYDAMQVKDGTCYLIKFHLLKTAATVYDSDEQELYQQDEKDAIHYRYESFAVRINETRPYFSLNYSYDYGKNWYRYKSDSFFTTSAPKAFYKDELIVTDAVFYEIEKRADLLIGRFQK